MDRNALIEILQQEGNLKHCFSHDEIESLAAHLSIETVQAETVLMKKGEPSCSMVFILDGLVQVIDGDRQLAIEKPGSIVGESLFSDEATRTADTRTIEQTTVGRFSVHDFEDLLNKNQPLALKFREYFRAITRAREQQKAAENFTDTRKYLALIAHNNMKQSLMEFCGMHSRKLEKFPLIATGTTGSMLHKKTGLVLST